ncbi:MAG: type I-G CRISPR-associated protein Csb2 [Acidimicrobiales bacterium]
MLAIEVELLAGTIRAGSPDDTALSGGGDEGEWPPSPARLFAALVAGGGSRERCVVGDASELVALETAPPPRIIADDRSLVLGSAQRERYVVVDERVVGSVQDYPARTATLVRPATRLAPLTPSMTYVWDDLDLDSGQLEALRIRTAHVGYLGCADSPVRVRLRDVPPEAPPLREWRPSESGSALIPVPFVGLLDVLDRAFDRFSAGEPVRRSWLPVERASYDEPGRGVGESQTPPIALWLGFGEPVPGRHTLRVTETLKAALLDLYDRHVAAGSGAPSVLHGHGFAQGSGYDHACFVALADCGHRHARGRLYGAAVLLPPSTPGDLVEGVRSALFHLRTLVLPRGRVITVGLYGGETRPWAANPARWTQPSRRWVSVTPVVHERRRRGGPDLAEVARWCAHAGLPDPVDFTTSPVPLLDGALPLRPEEVFHSSASRRPYSHLEVVFAEPVVGPVVLGRMRHLGIGLMAPAARGAQISGEAHR